MNKHELEIWCYLKSKVMVMSYVEKDKMTAKAAENILLKIDGHIDGLLLEEKENGNSE